ncbi:MAG: hypothetical protein H6865_00565 [Rhodospirillales bacterium]|nr:hypothetical protein [Alphaproteobacteria bacterium]MCB9986119.1 hypothetical protein [Rhodospirillales bacterium]USO07321.1 MAG: hypothetical protein H6866_07810 [Rhodospirillales bacterium]
MNFPITSSESSPSPSSIASVFTLVTLAGYKAAKADFAEPGKLRPYLATLGEADTDTQLAAIDGISTFWDDTIPECMPCLARQIAAVASQPWLRERQAAKLMDVSKKFGHFARAHEDYTSLRIVREAFKMHGQDVLEYTFDQGIQSAIARADARAPKPEKLVLAAA